MELRRILTHKDFAGIATADQTLVASVWTKIGVYTVPKGVRIAVGQRYDAHFYAHFEETDDDEVTARVRIVVSDPTEYNRRTVAEFDTRQCTENTKDKKLMPYAPLVEPWVKGDSKIIIEAMPTSAKVSIDYDHADNLIKIPVTVRSGK